MTRAAYVHSSHINSKEITTMNASIQLFDGLVLSADQANEVFASTSQPKELQTYFDSLNCAVCNDAQFVFEGPSDDASYTVRRCECSAGTDAETQNILDGYAALEAASRKAALVRQEKADADAKAARDAELIGNLMDALDSWGGVVRPEPKTEIGSGLEWDATHYEQDTPGFEITQALCHCERHFASLALYYTLRHNESRTIASTDDRGATVYGQARKELSLGTVKWALDIQRKCKAKIHYAHVMDDEFLGNDVVASSDEGKQIQNAEMQDGLLAAESSKDAQVDRYEGEFARYENRARFVEQLADERKVQLIRLIIAAGGDPRAEATIAWVQSRIERSRNAAARNRQIGVSEKTALWGVETLTDAQIRLRAYHSCMRDLKARLAA